MFWHKKRPTNVKARGLVEALPDKATEIEPETLRELWPP